MDYKRLTSRAADGEAQVLGTGHKIAFERLAAYEDAEIAGRIVILPNIKHGKTLYWIWYGKVVRFKFDKIHGGSVVNGKFRVMCKMTLLRDVLIGGHLIRKGDKRYFYADELNRDGIFTSRKEATKAIGGDTHD